MAIITTAFVAYANSFKVPFVFDDEMAIVSNPSLHHLSTAWWPPEDLSGLPISGRPVVNFGFGLNYAISGFGVWSYHIVNLLVHAGCGLLLFGIARRTLSLQRLQRYAGNAGFSIALATAVIWTAHPLETESVTYISQRAEALLAFFYLFSLYAFIRGAETSESAAPRSINTWYVGSIMACILGTLTKEVIVSAPLCIALYARIFLAQSWQETWTRYRRILIGTAVATWSVLGAVLWHEHGARGASAGFGLGVSGWTYLLTQCDAILLYLKLSVWPHPLILDYGTGTVKALVDVWWQALLLVTLFLATVWGIIRSRPVGWIGACFFMILAPSSSVLPLVGQTIAEHRMYLPLAAVIGGGVIAAHFLLGRRAIFALIACLVPLVFITGARNEAYATTIRICTDTVAKRPDNARAMALLGDYYRRAGHLTEARDWLERSLKVQPGIVPVLSNLGDIWLQIGDAPKAVQCFQAALQRHRDDAKLLNNLGNALIAAGNRDDGIVRIRAAVAVAPDSPSIRANLANALAQSGRMEEAAVEFDQLVRRQPNDPETRGDFASALVALGRTDEAVDQFRAAIRLKPDDADLHDRLGITLGRAGRLREALAEFQEAVRLNPSDNVARQNAEIARRRLGL